MTARAHVEHDWMSDGVRIGIQERHEDGGRIIYRFPDTYRQYVQPGGMENTIATDANAYLALPVEAARALYEALADHFGNATNDTRLLRRDYDAERARVDRLIAYATSSVAVTS